MSKGIDRQWLVECQEVARSSFLEYVLLLETAPELPKVEGNILDVADTFSPKAMESKSLEFALKVNEIHVHAKRKLNAASWEECVIYINCFYQYLLGNFK